jgi:hypothetical protein
MSLNNWLAAGWLAAHETSVEEIRDLFAVAEREPKDCRVPGLSSDTILGLGYDAALQVSCAALAAAGYRAARARRQWLPLQSLAHTIGADSKLLARLDAFRQAQPGRLRARRLDLREGGGRDLRAGDRAARPGARLDREDAPGAAAAGQALNARTIVH